VNFNLKHKNIAKLIIVIDIVKSNLVYLMTATSICISLFYAVLMILTDLKIFNLINFVFINFQALYEMALTFVLLYFGVALLILSMSQLYIFSSKNKKINAICKYHIIAFYIYVLLIKDPSGTLGMHDINEKRNASKVFNISELLKIIEYVLILLDILAAKIFKTKKETNWFEKVKKYLLKQRLSWKKFVVSENLKFNN
jgi:hypothetical protein